MILLAEVCIYIKTSKHTDVLIYIHTQIVEIVEIIEIIEISIKSIC